MPIKEELKHKIIDGKITKIGLLEQANNGTLFIDEVASLSLEAQAFFIKALQDNAIRRKNGSSVIFDPLCSDRFGSRDGNTHGTINDHLSNHPHGTGYTE